MPSNEVNNPSITEPLNIEAGAGNSPRSLNFLHLTIHWMMIICIPVSALYLIGFYLIHLSSGYNLTDEGFYLLTSAHLDDNKLQITVWAQYLHLLMRLNDNIIFLRLVTLLIELFSITVLAISFARIMRLGRVNKRMAILLMICSMVAVLGLQFVFPNIPNYNVLTVDGTVIFFSVMLLAFTAKNNQVAAFYLFILGFLSAFIFFIKFPTGVILFFLSLLTLGILCRNNKPLLTQGIITLIVGMVFHFLLYFILIESWQQWLMSLQAGWQSLHIMNSNHSLNLLLKYWHELVGLLFSLISKYQMIGYLTLVYCGLRQIPAFKQVKIARTVFSYLVLSLNYCISFSQEGLWASSIFTDTVLFYLATIVTLIIISLVNLNVTAEPIKSSRGLTVGSQDVSTSVDSADTLQNLSSEKTLLLMTLLFLLPVIIALGTNNYLPMQMLFSCFVWMPIIVFLAYQNSSTLGVSFVYFTMAILTTFSVYHSINFWEDKPYGLYGGLADQIHLTHVHHSQLYLDSTSKFIIESTRDQLQQCGFKPNDYLVSLTDLPGLTYAVEGRSPACPWYFGGYQGSEQFAQFCLGLFSSKKSPFVLFASYPGQQPGFSEDRLNDFFKDFSKRYVVCGEVAPIPTDKGACCKVPIERIKIYKPRIGFFTI